MRPKKVVEKWVEAFNKKDLELLANLYTEDAINHQVANQLIEGKAAIRKMFEEVFAEAEMVCIIENIFEAGDWAILNGKTRLV